MAKDIWCLLDKLEKAMVKGTVLIIITLILVQFFMINKSGRDLLSQTDRMEGEIIQSFSGTEKKAVLPPLLVQRKNAFLTMTLLNKNVEGKVKILVNGKEIGQFTDKILTVKVNEKDNIQLDTAECLAVVKIKITDVSKNLLYPQLNKQFICKGNIINLGIVKIRN